MKLFRDLLTEALGLNKAIRRGKYEGVGEKFAARQGARSASKFGSSSVVPRGKGARSEVPSYKAIGAQFGVDVEYDATGKATNTPYTKTEDSALTGNIRGDEKVQGIFKKTFLKSFRKTHARSLGSY
jgi:hypothetical protein